MSEVQISTLNPSQLAMILRVRVLAALARVQRIPRTAEERLRLERFISELVDDQVEVFDTPTRLKRYLLCDFTPPRSASVSGGVQGRLPKLWHDATVLYLKRYSGEVPRRLIWEELGITRDSLGRLIRENGMKRQDWLPIERSLRDDLQLSIPGSKWNSLKTLQLGMVADAYGLSARELLAFQPLSGAELVARLGTHGAPKRLSEGDLPAIEAHLGVWRTFRDEYLQNAKRSGSRLGAEQYAIGVLYPQLFPGWLTNVQLARVIGCTQDQVTVFIRKAGYESAEALERKFREVQTGIVKRMDPSVVCAEGDISDILLLQIRQTSDGYGSDVLAAQHVIGRPDVARIQRLLEVKLTFLDSKDERELSLVERAVLYRFVQKHMGKCRIAEVARRFGVKPETFVRHMVALGTTSEQWQEARKRYLESLPLSIDGAELPAVKLVFAKLCKEVCRIPAFVIRQSFFPDVSQQSFERDLAHDLSDVFPRRKAGTEPARELTPTEHRALSLILTMYQGWFTDGELAEFFRLNRTSVFELRQLLTLDEGKRREGRRDFAACLKLNLEGSRLTFADLLLLKVFIAETRGSVASAKEKGVFKFGIDQLRSLAGREVPDLRRYAKGSVADGLSFFGERVVVQTLRAHFGEFPLNGLAKRIGVSLSAIRFAMGKLQEAQSMEAWRSKYNASPFRAEVVRIQYKR